MRTTGRSDGKNYFVKGRKPPDVLNQVELRYAAELGLQLSAGRITSYQPKPFKLRLADNTYYEPDFAYQRASDGELVVVEVKVTRRTPQGFAMLQTDASRIKTKVAAEQFPWFHFIYARERHSSEGRGFAEEEV